MRTRTDAGGGGAADESARQTGGGVCVDGRSVARALFYGPVGRLHHGQNCAGKIELGFVERAAGECDSLQRGYSSAALADVLGNGRRAVGGLGLSFAGRALFRV